MGKQVVVNGELKPDGSLELEQTPALPAGRVRVTVESMAEPSRPERFWAMMGAIWADLSANGRTPRTREAIDAEINALRDEADEELRAVERLHEAGRPGPAPEQPGRGHAS